MAESMQNTQDPYYTLAEGVPLPRNDTTNQTPVVDLFS